MDDQFIKSEALQKLLESVKLPPLPQTLIDLNRLIKSEYPDINKMAQVIQRDAGISGLLLKTVNSPLFALRSEVLSINHAINMLGTGYVTDIVTGLLLRQAMGNTTNQAIEALWQSQMNTASLVATLSERYLDGEVDEGYLLGLFHNCGQMLIASKHQDYDTFLTEFENHAELTLTEAEKQHYNYNHADLGCLLAYSWGLPKYLCDIILKHHAVETQLDASSIVDDDSIENGLMAVLKIAEHIDKLDRGYQPDHEWARVQNSVLGYLGLSELDFEDLQEDLLEMLLMVH